MKQQVGVLVVRMRWNTRSYSKHQGHGTADLCAGSEDETGLEVILQGHGVAGLCAGRGDEMGHSYTPGIRVMGQQICVLVVGLGWDTEVILPVSVSRGSTFECW